MDLRLEFETKHEARIAKGIVELLENGSHVFFKPVESASYVRVSGLSGDRPLKVVYDGPAKGVITTLINNGIIKLERKACPIGNGPDYGYPLQKA